MTNGGTQKDLDADGEAAAIPAAFATTEEVVTVRDCADALGGFDETGGSSLARGA